MYEPVLVLNANFEPINVCNIRRAIGLILNDRANLVLNGRGEIRTVSRVYPRPSIIRLDRMIKRPRPGIRLSKREVLRRDNYTCQYCGAKSLNLTVDHIIPRHLGGQHQWENLVAACPVCNHHKGSHTPDQVKMTLLRMPKEPPASAMYLFSRYLGNNQEWLPFVEGW
jgi:5-methylcytosine-specific restriction endonuclease McrA